MAEITVAESAGFCFGVDRAVKLCYQALEEHHNIATLGPIIHNQDVVDDLTRRGARIVDSIAELHPDECVVIRSHGVSAKASAGLAAAVAAAVGLAGQFLDEGVFLLLIGFFRLIRNALIPAIFSQGLPHGSHDLRKLRVTLVLGGR